MAHLHSLGIYHRDLKPENIFYKDNSPSAQIMILDFNLAKAAALPDLGGANTPCGTTPYIAPEVLQHRVYNQVGECVSNRPCCTEFLTSVVFALLLWRLLLTRFPIAPSAFSCLWPCAGFGATLSRIGCPAWSSRLFAQVSLTLCVCPLAFMCVCCSLALSALVLP